MQRPRSTDEQPGTKTRNPAEGRRADAPSEAVNADIVEQPGTKIAPPAEGGDNVSGADQPKDRRQ